MDETDNDWNKEEEHWDDDDRDGIHAQVGGNDAAMTEDLHTHGKNVSHLK